MSNYKTNKNSFNLKKNFNFLYFKELINQSAFIIYFNIGNNSVSSKNLYFLKNEIKKKNLKSFIIEKTHFKGLFDGKLKYFSSNTFFICCNNFSSFLFMARLLNNIKFFYLFNKNFSRMSFDNSLDYSVMLNNGLNNLHFVLFKPLFYLLLIILLHVINLIKSMRAYI